MADLSPMGAVVSYAGVAIGSAQHVSDKGFPTIDPAEVSALESVLGLVQPVDLFNTTQAPRIDTFTCSLLIRAQDATTDPVAAYQEVAAGFRALQGLPPTGVLVVNNDTGGSGTVSCTARFKRAKLELTPSNARHYVYMATFMLKSPWA